MPKVSVIIPVYAVEAYLSDCLDSVLHQSFPLWEAICVDDGSTDHSAEILADYAAKDERIRMVSQPNGGLSSARNAGIGAATGDYILFLDGDDWLEPDALETINRSLDGEDMVCFSGRRYLEASKSFNDADQLLEKTYASGMEYYDENALQRRDFAFVCVVLRAYKRSFLLENNLRFKEGIFHEDNLFTPMACCFAKKVRVINASLYVYRLRANSITSTCDLKHLEDMMETANGLAAFFIPRREVDKGVVYRVITHHFQVPFVRASKAERRELKKLCDWDSYREVSRSKLRHRWNYLRNRLF